MECKIYVCALQGKKKTRHYFVYTSPAKVILAARIFPAHFKNTQDHDLDIKIKRGEQIVAHATIRTLGGHGDPEIADWHTDTMALEENTEYSQENQGYFWWRSKFQQGDIIQFTSDAELQGHELDQRLTRRMVGLGFNTLIAEQPSLAQQLCEQMGCTFADLVETKIIILHDPALEELEKFY